MARMKNGSVGEGAHSRLHSLYVFAEERVFWGYVEITQEDLTIFPVY